MATHGDNKAHATDYFKGDRVIVTRGDGPWQGIVTGYSCKGRTQGVWVLLDGAKEPKLWAVGSIHLDRYFSAP